VDFILIAMKLCMKLTISSLDVFNILWSDSLSFYSWFNKMIILGGTYAIGEGKMQNASLDTEFCLFFKTNNLPPMHH